MKGYPKLIKNLDFLFLWFAQVISQFGDKLNQMALISWAYSLMPGSSFLMAKLIFFTIAPVFVVGPFVGSAVDRLDYRKTMYFCDLSRAILVFVIAIWVVKSGLIIPMYIMVFLSFSFARLFIPARMAIVPAIVDKEDVLSANSLLSLTGTVAAMMGFGMGGILVQKLGTKAGFITDGITFLCSALLIFMIGKKYKQKPVSIRDEAVGIGKPIVMGMRYVFKLELLRDMRKAIKYIISDVYLRHLFFLSFLIWSLLGGVYATGIVFIQKALHTVTEGLGIIVVFIAFGLFIGSLLWGKFGRNVNRFMAIYLSTSVTCFILFMFVWSMKLLTVGRFFVACVFMFLLGLVASPIIITGQTMIHERADQKVMGRLFAIMEIVMHLAFAVAMFGSSMLAEVFSPGAVLGLWAGIGIGMGIDGIIRRKFSLQENIN